MERPSIEILNNTSSLLRFSLTHTIDGNIPSLSDEGIFSISPSESKKVSWVNEGTANLFVWDEEGEVKWKGIIPAKVQKPIILSQNGEKVFFDSMELPKDFMPTTSFQQNTNTSQPFFYVMLILLFIFILVCLGHYFFSKN